MEKIKSIISKIKSAESFSDIDNFLSKFRRVVLNIITAFFLLVIFLSIVGSLFDSEKIDTENIKIENKIYEKIYYENNYLDLLKKILNEGLEKDSRNSKTLSLFSEKLEFDLEKIEKFSLCLNYV